MLTIPSGENGSVANNVYVQRVLGRFDSDWQVATKRIFCILTLDQKPRLRRQSYIGPPTVGPDKPKQYIFHVNKIYRQIYRRPHAQRSPKGGANPTKGANSGGSTIELGGGAAAPPPPPPPPHRYKMPPLLLNCRPPPHYAIHMNTTRVTVFQYSGGVIHSQRESCLLWLK